MRKIKIFILVLFLLFGYSFSKAQNLTDSQVKALYVFKLSDYFKWPHENNLDTIKIAFWGDDISVFDALNKFSKKIKIKNKPLNFTKVSYYEDIKNFQVIYLSSKNPKLISEVYAHLQNQHTLLITDNALDKTDVMINIIPSKSGKNLEFEVNKANVLLQGLEMSPKILLLGGTELEVAKLYQATTDELKIEKDKVIQQRKQLQLQIKKLENQQKELKIQERKINDQTKSIVKQRQLLDAQKKELLKISYKVKDKERLLQIKLLELRKKEGSIAEQNKLINSQRTEMKKRSSALDKMRVEISTQQQKIKKQRAVLEKQLIKISTQKQIMWIISVFLGIVLILIIFIVRSYKQKQRINKELAQKNEEISQQKEELQQTVEKLALANEELEKLSIVAEKTDNAILITNEVGDFVWANHSFTKLYGYTLDEFIKLKGVNLFDMSSNKNLRQLVNEAISDKTSVIYQTETSNKEGSKLWIQTTLTPILTSSQEIKSLIILDTDITEIKKAEREISAQTEEFKQINWMLSEQKKELEIKNENINASIRVAKLIQQTIFPPYEKLNQYFSVDVLFLPKEIVSGDFYWSAKVSFEDKKYLFYAAVDCTGHGVPGAFMSLIGSRILNEIIYMDKIYSPAEILSKLNEDVIRELHQDSSVNRDGMDLALARVEWKADAEEYPVVFSGAKRDMYFIPPDTDEVFIVKGVRKKIAGPEVRTELNYENNHITLSPKTVFYLSSDGFIDQSNKERKRYGTNKFINFISTIKDKSTEEQVNELKKSLAEYSVGSGQRDDITVMVIKI